MDVYPFNPAPGRTPRSLEPELSVYGKMPQKTCIPDGFGEGVFGMQPGAATEDCFEPKSLMPKMVEPRGFEPLIRIPVGNHHKHQ